MSVLKLSTKKHNFDLAIVWLLSKQVKYMVLTVGGLKDMNQFSGSLDFIPGSN